MIYVSGQRASSANITNALKDLTRYLYTYYEKKVVILVDKYDTPIQSGFLNQHYEESVNFFRNFLDAALKDNPYLFKSVLTGILRISRESLFSGLNNVKVYSMLEEKYAQYFGFTQEEVNHLLDETKLNKQADDIKLWYNGYQSGSCVLYNPWSVVNYMRDKKFIPYWINTSDDSLIKKLLLKSGADFKSQLEHLFQRKTTTQLVNENFIYTDLGKNNDVSAWSFLLMTG